MLKTKKLLKEDQLRMRVAQAKAQIGRGKDYTTLYIYEFGEQTKKQLDRIRNVWNLRAVDETITANLEAIAGKMDSK